MKASHDIQSPHAPSRVAFIQGGAVLREFPATGEILVRTEDTGGAHVKPTGSLHERLLHRLAANLLDNAQKSPARGWAASSCAPRLAEQIERIDTLKRQAQDHELIAELTQLQFSLSAIRDQLCAEEIAGPAWVPKTPEEIANLIGSDFGSRVDAVDGTPLSPLDVKYTLSVHDLLCIMQGLAERTAG